MTQSKLRLLLLSIGSLSAQNVIDALGARRDRCVLIGTNSVPEAAGNFRCDTTYLVPPAAAGAAYIERIAELIQIEGPDLVIPCRDDDILALAVLGEQSRCDHAVLLAGTVAATRIMNDKVETARFAARHSLPFPPTAANAHEALEFAKVYGLPLIGKPRCGNGSRGVVLLRSTAEIERAFELHPDLIAQPFLDPPSNMDALIAPFETGLPFFFSFPVTAQPSAQIVIGPDGAISSPFGTLSTQVGGQPVHKTRCHDSELLEVGRAYALAAAADGWKGPLIAQFRRSHLDGNLAALELNGRFGGATAARCLMGCDEIGEVVNRFLPHVSFPAIAEDQSDFVQNYLTSYPVPCEGVVALQTYGRWSRG